MGYWKRGGQGGQGINKNKEKEGYKKNKSNKKEREGHKNNLRMPASLVQK